MAVRKTASLWKGRFLQVKHRKNWEYVTRPNCTGIIAVVAVTREKKLILVEQFRPPVNCRVIELPAGLAGDIEGEEREGLERAARRELLEETGYEARTWKWLTRGPSSAGLTDEVIDFFKATNLKRVAEGGGDSNEDITVHEVPLARVNAWLKARQKDGLLIDYKVQAGLYFVK